VKVSTRNPAPTPCTPTELYDCFGGSAASLTEHLDIQQHAEQLDRLKQYVAGRGVRLCLACFECLLQGALRGWQQPLLYMCSAGFIDCQVAYATRLQQQCAKADW
jgi:hypothetical protein